ncbi:hypothetical protein AAZX31_17G204500 [Glycine max]|uniref:Protein TAPETUM DETERMINANT 1 n=1 Tax=Glycine soja TaxID=3848 RepID=A0A0B2SP85_GLYSO|nr:hypothetical protein JHK86_048337 [Glycine max]KAG4934125.1 hypothetical protein JHK87_048127 [Glycine soja]KAG5103400.1 hypothetical protein JHK84_048369 [Glycine max]KAH1203677.1 Protein TAPETUM DETERMINANT 1 [Glycine max]KHN46354.1 hypothetical protein glysoja_036432 [Glycine soja]
MVDSTIKILSIVLFLGFVSQGYSQCFLSDLSVSQIQTGVKMQGKPEWNVTITNNCSCVQKNVILSCNGFQSVEQIDPSLLKISPNGCLVNDGQPIYTDAIKFKYVWNQSFPLNPISSEIACS